MDGLREGSRIAMGSLPGVDPVSAVKTQFQIFPEIPAWPQLPKKSLKERMGFQGLSGLPGLSWPSNDQGVFSLGSTDLAEVLEMLKAENQNNILGRASFKTEEAAGFFSFLSEAPGLLTGETLALKGQGAGPITLGLMLRDENGKPLLSSKDSMKVLTEYCLLHFRWQAQQLARLKKPVVFFVDEPFLNGRFQPEQYGIGWKDIEAWLAWLFSSLQEDGVLTGLHCCGEGPWDWAFQLPMEFFHFDGFQYLPRLLENPGSFCDFIRQGGLVSFGMVPTSMKKGTFPDPAELFQSWEDAFLFLQKKDYRRRNWPAVPFFPPLVVWVIVVRAWWKKRPVALEPLFLFGGPISAADNLAEKFPLLGGMDYRKNSSE